MLSFRTTRGKQLAVSIRNYSRNRWYVLYANTHHRLKSPDEMYTNIRRKSCTEIDFGERKTNRG